MFSVFPIILPSKLDPTILPEELKNVIPLSAAKDAVAKAKYTRLHNTTK